MPKRKSPHGGARAGAGRKPRFGVPMRQRTVRLPEAWSAALVAEFGSIQKAIETLVEAYLGKRPA